MTIKIKGIKASFIAALCRIYYKIIGVEPKKVNFVYYKESYDRDVTVLGFMNTVKHEFQEQVDEFNAALEEEIRQEVEDIK